MILALSHAKIKTNLYSYNKFVPNYTWKHIQMKMLYLFLIFSFIALNNTLSNNNTCQCTCHDPYITEKGNIIFMLQINLPTCPCPNSTSIYTSTTSIPNTSTTNPPTRYLHNCFLAALVPCITKKVYIILMLQIILPLLIMIKFNENNTN